MQGMCGMQHGTPLLTNDELRMKLNALINMFGEKSEDKILENLGFDPTIYKNACGMKNWFYVDGYCYHVKMNDYNSNFDISSAISYCDNLNSTLAVFPTILSSIMVSFEIRKLDNFDTIGDSALKGHRWWIGLSFKNGTLAWEDGTVFDKTSHKLADSQHGKNYFRIKEIESKMNEMLDKNVTDYAIMNDGDQDEWSWGDSYSRYRYPGVACSKSMENVTVPQTEIQLTTEEAKKIKGRFERQIMIHVT